MNRTTIIIIIAAIAGGYLLGHLIPAKQPKTYLKEYIGLLEDRVAKSERRSDSLIASAGEDRKAAQQFKDKDTVYIRQLVTNDKKLKDVINSTRDASKDELRSYRPED